MSVTRVVRQTSYVSPCTILAIAAETLERYVSRGCTRDSKREVITGDGISGIVGGTLVPVVMVLRVVVLVFVVLVVVAVVVVILQVLSEEGAVFDDCAKAESAADPAVSVLSAELANFSSLAATSNIHC